MFVRREPYDLHRRERVRNGSAGTHLDGDQHVPVGERTHLGLMPPCMQISVAPRSTASATFASTSSVPWLYASFSQRCRLKAQNWQLTKQTFVKLTLRLTTYVTASPTSSGTWSAAAIRRAGRRQSSSAAARPRRATAPSRRAALDDSATSGAAAPAAARAACRPGSRCRISSVTGFMRRFPPRCVRRSSRARRPRARAAARRETPAAHVPG